VSRANAQVNGGPQVSNGDGDGDSDSPGATRKGRKRANCRRRDEGGYKEKSVSSRAFSSAQRQAVRSPGQGCMACTVLSVAEELTLVCGRCSRLASASWCCELRAARLRKRCSSADTGPRPGIMLPQRLPAIRSRLAAAGGVNGLSPLQTIANRGISRLPDAPLWRQRSSHGLAQQGDQLLPSTPQGRRLVYLFMRCPPSPLVSPHSHTCTTSPSPFHGLAV
jgi:hypothetical protein